MTERDVEKAHDTFRELLIYPAIIILPFVTLRILLFKWMWWCFEENRGIKKYHQDANKINLR